jgi:ribosome-associated toxin RatA of RatAB toxin-antitoxin module
MWAVGAAVLLLVASFVFFWRPAPTPPLAPPMDRARALAGEDLIHAAAGDTNVGRALFALECSATEALAILWDLEAYPRMVPDVARVHIAEATRRGAVTADVTVRVGFLELTTRLAHVRRPDGTIAWNMVGDDSWFFRSNRGSWRVEAAGARRCLVEYAIEIETRVRLPSALTREVVARGVPAAVAWVRAEVAQRRGRPRADADPAASWCAAFVRCLHSAAESSR